MNLGLSVRPSVRASVNESVSESESPDVFLKLVH